MRVCGPYALPRGRQGCPEQSPKAHSAKQTALDGAEALLLGIGVACGIAAGSFGYKLHIELHTGVKASVDHACLTETDDHKLRANAASR